MTILISYTRLLKQPDGLAWHRGAVLYAAAAYAAGIAGLFHVSWLVNIACTRNDDCRIFSDVVLIRGRRKRSQVACA
jgi:hypothetical protein